MKIPVFEEPKDLYSFLDKELQALGHSSSYIMSLYNTWCSYVHQSNTEEEMYYRLQSSLDTRLFPVQVRLALVDMNFSPKSLKVYFENKIWIT